VSEHEGRLLQYIARSGQEKFIGSGRELVAALGKNPKDSREHKKLEAAIRRAVGTTYHSNALYMDDERIISGASHLISSYEFEKSKRGELMDVEICLSDSFWSIATLCKSVLAIYEEIEKLSTGSRSF